MKPTIESIQIDRVIDDTPDISCIGGYTNDYDPWNICVQCGEYLIDAERGGRAITAIEARIDELDPEFDGVKIEALEWALEKFNPHDCYQDPRLLPYFAPYAGGEKKGTAEYRKYGQQDFAHITQLTDGDVWFEGIKATVTLRLQFDGYSKHRTFSSPGIWGVESNTDDSYLRETAQSELDELKRELEVYGVDLSNFDELATEALDDLS